MSSLSFLLVMARLTGLARLSELGTTRFALRFAGRLVAATEVGDVLGASAVAVQAMVGASREPASLLR